MKKLIAFVLTAVMLLSLAACGYINDAEVSILWSGNGKVENPSTLINAVERAMYIENISYKHYGANGDQAEQTKQAEAALKAGCAALAVELVDVTAAQTIVDMAKEKNVPVVFFNCDVADDVISSYGKCALVAADKDSVTKVQNDQLAETFKDEKAVAEFDRNGDGKLNYLAIGEVGKIDNKLLTPVEGSILELKMENYEVEKTVLFFFKSKTEYGKLLNAKGDVVEMIITTDDATAMISLLALQELGFNTNKLATHFAPIYTVGRDVDYKSVVMLEMPEPPVAYEKWATAEAQEKLSKDETGKLDKWWKEDKAVSAWKEEYTNLCNLSAVEWKDLGAYLYTTAEVIGAGRLSGAVVEDLDTIAVSMATVVRNLLKGNEIVKDIPEESAKNKQTILISYTTIGA